MIRSCLLLLSFAFTLMPAFGAEQPLRQRYLVATRQPSSELALALSRGVAVKHFKSVNGFAAELTAEELERLRKSPEVLFIEPDLERRAIGFVPAQGGANLSATATPSTQRTPYGIDMVQAPRVWPRSKGATIRVGVIDTGTTIDHPDLAANYRGGYDFAHNDDVPEDESGHGTHVTGTVAAADNELGVVGVAPEVEIYALKVLSGREESGLISDVIRAIDWAIEHKLHIISLSLGSELPSILEEQAFQRAWDAGVLAVAAAGNGYGGGEGLSYPAAYATVLSVGAIDSQQNIALFSQRGPALKIVAPGVAVLSCKIVGVEVAVIGMEGLDASELEGSARGDVTGRLVFAGLGHPEDFPPAMRRSIALLRRGELLFRDKVRNALKAGATAAVIYNSFPGSFVGTLIRDTWGNVIPEEANFPWPVTVSISMEDGEELRRLEGAEITLSARTGGYGRLSGTSMATPHVSGVAALIWSLAPEATAHEVRRALLASTTDLGDRGFDTTFGHGLVNAAKAAKLLAPDRLRDPLPRPSPIEQ